jgi:hypothetical protein
MAGQASHSGQRIYTRPQRAGSRSVVIGSPNFKPVTNMAEVATCRSKPRPKCTPARYVEQGVDWRSSSGLNETSLAGSRARSRNDWVIARFAEALLDQAEFSGRVSRERRDLVADVTVFGGWARMVWLPVAARPDHKVVGPTVCAMLCGGRVWPPGADASGFHGGTALTGNLTTAMEIVRFPLPISNRSNV